MNISVTNKTLTIEDSCPKVVKILNEEFRKAQDHRRSIGVDDRLKRALLQATSQYEPCVKARFREAKEPDVYFPLGAMKARAQTSWLKDVVSSTRDKMWTGEPTPIPELPEYVIVEIRDEVLSELRGSLDQGGILNFNDVNEIVNSITDERIDREYAYAKEKSDRMSRLILDQWLQGGLSDTWSDAISDLGRSAVTIIKGPVEVERRSVKWSSTGKLVEHYNVEPIMYRVAPENFYPTPDVSHDVNSGTGIFELATMSVVELNEAKLLNTYNSEIIDNILDSNPNGWEINDLNNSWAKDIINRSEGNYDLSLGKGLYHTIKYYGKMKVESIRSDGTIKDIPDSLDDQSYVNVEAWVIKDQLIYLNIEPYTMGVRPFCVIPREFVAGSIWGGESLQSMIETPAKIINALVRQQVLNMGYAAGPIGEAEAIRFPGKVPKYVEPRKIYSVSPGTHGEKAMRFTDIPSRTSDYITTINFYLQNADSLSGIPSFVEGSPSGVRGLTNGQTEFSFGQASRGIDSLLIDIDRFFIEPMLLRYYYRNLVTIDDDSIKGDVKWKARGLSGVFNKQLKRSESIAAIQLLGQLRQVMPSYVTEESFLEVISPIFDNIGLDIDRILSENNNQDSNNVNSIVNSLDVEPTDEGITLPQQLG